jgi:putative flippase GtrA
MPPVRSTITPEDPVVPSVPGRRLIPLALKLIAFCFAGGVGFAVDLLVTMTFINFGLGARSARACGIAIALFATYVINRGITFRREAGVGPKAVATEGARYVAVALATSALNWAVFASVLAVIPGFPPAIAIMTGSATAMVVSYLGYAKMVFRG